MQWVWRNSRAQNAARLVLLAIADNCAHDDGTGAWPSNAELASKTNLSERAVQVAVKKLVEINELKVEWGGGRSGTNRYTVVMTNLNPADPAGIPALGNPAGSAPFEETPQDLHPEESAGGRTDEGSQARADNPADPARNPAESAPGTVKNRKNRKPRKRSDLNAGRLDVERICVYLADKIESNGSLRPTITDEWRTEARRLIDLDKRSVENIIKAIDWAHNSVFWRINIKSMSKLRKQYDTLRLQALAEAKAKQAGSEARSEAPASNAPPRLAPDEMCPDHRGRRKDNCGLCRAAERGKATVP